jgi:hypothetical protein
MEFDSMVFARAIQIQTLPISGILADVLDQIEN